MDSRTLAHSLLNRCFSEAELEVLIKEASFLAATREMNTVEDAVKAVEIGQQILRSRWQKPAWPRPPRPKHE